MKNDGKLDYVPLNKRVVLLAYEIVDSIGPENMNYEDIRQIVKSIHILSRDKFNERMETRSLIHLIVEYIREKTGKEFKRSHGEGAKFRKSKNVLAENMAATTKKHGKNIREYSQRILDFIQGEEMKVEGFLCEYDYPKSKTFTRFALMLRSFKILISSNPKFKSIFIDVEPVIESIDEDYTYYRYLALFHYDPSGVSNLSEVQSAIAEIYRDNLKSFRDNQTDDMPLIPSLLVFTNNPDNYRRGVSIAKYMKHGSDVTIAEAIEHILPSKND